MAILAYNLYVKHTAQPSRLVDLRAYGADNCGPGRSWMREGWLLLTARGNRIQHLAILVEMLVLGVLLFTALYSGLSCHFHKSMIVASTGVAMLFLVDIFLSIHPLYRWAPTRIPLFLER